MLVALCRSEKERERENRRLFCFRSYLRLIRVVIKSSVCQVEIRSTMVIRERRQQHSRRQISGSRVSPLAKEWERKREHTLSALCHTVRVNYRHMSLIAAILYFDLLAPSSRQVYIDQYRSAFPAYFICWKWVSRLNKYQDDIRIKYRGSIIRHKNYTRQQSLIYKVFSII